MTGLMPKLARRPQSASAAVATAALSADQREDGFALLPGGAYWADETGHRLPALRCSPVEVVTAKPSRPEPLGRIWHFESGVGRCGPFAAKAKLDNGHAAFALRGVDSKLAQRLLETASAAALTGQRRTGSDFEELDERAAREAFERFCRLGCPVQVTGSWGTRLSALLQPGGAVFFAWADRELAEKIEPPFRLAVHTQYTQYTFVVDAFDAEGCFAPPSRATRSRGRFFRRCAAPVGVRLRMRHPIFPELQLIRRVREFSLLGLAFECEHPDDVLWPGLEVDFELIWKGGSATSLRGAIRHITPINDGRAICGVRVFAESETAERFWHSDVVPLVYPSTRSVTPKDFDGIWELYTDSGYFNLSNKSEADFANLRRDWERARQKLVGPPRILTSVIRNGRTNVEGALELCRFWPRSVIGFHMARRKQGRPMVHSDNAPLRELHAHAYELAQRHPEVDWLVGYVQESARFSRIIHHDFATQFVDDGRAAIVRFRAIEVPVRFPLPSPSFSNGTRPITVRLPSSDEFAAVMARLRETRPRPYREALHLTAHDFMMRDFTAEWGKTHCIRRRAMFVAHDGSVVRAAAICDAAEEGLHLFGILDALRIYPMTAPSPEVTLALLDAAESWYAGLGKHRFVFLDESLGPIDLGPERAIDLGLADATFMHCNLVPELLEFVNHVTYEL
ncbi:MAG: hypothetical protein AAGF12_05315 [Myxococcota bacterium]